MLKIGPLGHFGQFQALPVVVTLMKMLNLHVLCEVRQSAEESGIHTIPLVTLKGIWSKAMSLLQGENTITSAPEKDRLDRAVISYHSPTLSNQRKTTNTFVIQTADSGFPAKFVYILLLLQTLVTHFSSFWIGMCPLHHSRVLLHYWQ